jgi:hypothetical protein
MAIRINNGFEIGVNAPPPAPPLVPGPVAAPALTNQNLPIGHVVQQKSEWCWAACTKMVLSNFGQPVRQCDVVEFLFDEVCCPSVNDVDTCNSGCDKEDILTIYEHFNVTATVVEDSDDIVFNEIRSEIRDRGRPVQVLIEWDEGGAHVVVIYGWRVQGNYRYLRIHDSLNNGSGEIRITQLRRYEDQGDWTLTWIGFDGI